MSSLSRAISNSYVSLPDLTLSSSLLRKYPPQTVPTAKGHLDQYRHGMRRTKTHFHEDSDKAILDETDSDRHPVPTPRTSNRASAYTQIVNVNEIRHSDLTGRFHIPAKSGPNMS